MVKVKCPYFTSVTRNSIFIKLKNLRPTLHSFYPLPPFSIRAPIYGYRYLKLLKATQIGEEVETRIDLRSHLGMELMDPPHRQHRILSTNSIVRVSNQIFIKVLKGLQEQKENCLKTTECTYSPVDYV